MDNTAYADGHPVPASDSDDDWFSTLCLEHGFNEVSAREFLADYAGLSD